MAPLDGARAFLDGLRSRYQVIILSDTFYEFADPLMQQLGRPTLFCHRLETDAEGFVAAYHLRQPNQKFHAVNALKALNYQVIAAGDSYNDTGMLGAADAGFFIHPPREHRGAVPAVPGAPRLRVAAGGDRRGRSAVAGRLTAGAWAAWRRPFSAGPPARGRWCRGPRTPVRCRQARRAPAASRAGRARAAPATAHAPSLRLRR